MTRDETQALGYAIAILRDRLDVEASHNATIIRGYINTLAALRSRPAPPDDPQLGGHQCINVALDAANFCALRGDPLHAVGIRILVERYQKLAAPVAPPAPETPAPDAMPEKGWAAEMLAETAAWAGSCEGCPYPDTCSWFRRCTFRRRQEAQP